jgi:hypothetical protein
MTLIRMRIDVLGMFYGLPNGVRRGDIIDLEPAAAERNVLSGYADYAPVAPRSAPPPVEKAVAPQHHVETAKLEIPPEIDALAKPKPKPLDEPEEPDYGETDPPDDPPEQMTKRRAPRRPGR